MMKVRLVVLMFLAVSALCGTSATAQSRDRERPTPISGTTYSGNLQDENPDGTDAYYFSVNVEPGTIHATLDYTSPPGVTSMSVFFSGPACCPPESELGDTDTHDESTFRVTSRQTLLIEVYVASEPGRNVPFTLTLEGSVGGSGGTTICTDLSLTLVTYKAEKVGAKEVRVTITGILANESTGDFVSGDGQQRIKILERFATSVSVNTLYTQPFTTVRTRGRLAFATTKTYRLADFLSLRPNYRVSIVYDSALGSDDNARNDDCVATNNTLELAYRAVR
jgi:hypothetical protein